VQFNGNGDRQGRTFAGFALLAVFVASLGMYRLVSFAVERRTMEIGLRKVLGATNSRIVWLLSWQFARLVLVVNLIAWPIAWYCLNDWLDAFAYRIDLTPLPFIVAGLTALALFAIVGHTVRVTRANPFHALRCE